MKLSLTCVDKSFVRMPMNGDTFLRILDSTKEEEVVGEVIGIGVNDTDRNVPFFEIRYPHNERVMAFAPAGTGFHFI